MKMYEHVANKQKNRVKKNEVIMPSIPQVGETTDE